MCRTTKCMSTLDLVSGSGTQHGYLTQHVNSREQDMRTAAGMRRTMPYYSFYLQTARSVANCRDYHPTMGYAHVQPINLLTWAEMYSRLP